jgi:hypothetical protein
MNGTPYDEGDDVNLLQETISVLTDNGKTPSDVRWVGCGLVSAPWEEFARLADRTYDNGYGGAEVSGLLVIVGDDWWLERHEYDGSEWWEFKRLPTRPPPGVLDFWEAV